MLALPAEAADARAAVALRAPAPVTAVPRMAGGWLVADGEQRAVGDRLDEAVAQRVRRDAEGADVVLEGHALDDVGIRGARLDQRAAERLEELAVVRCPVRCSADLARAAGHDVLVALAAALRVVGRPESVGTVSTSSKMKRLSLNERSGTTLSSSSVSKAGPCGSKPLVRLSKPAAPRSQPPPRCAATPPPSRRRGLNRV